MDKKVTMSRPYQVHPSKYSGSAQQQVRGDRVIHDEELGEENVELVDSEWADFERALRYFQRQTYCIETRSNVLKFVILQRIS